MWFLQPSSLATSTEAPWLYRLSLYQGSQTRCQTQHSSQGGSESLWQAYPPKQRQQKKIDTCTFTIPCDTALGHRAIENAFLKLSNKISTCTCQSGWGHGLT